MIGPFAGGTSYEYVLLMDFRDAPENVSAGRSDEQVGQDVALELAEITTSLCSLSASRVQGWDVEETQFGFVNIFVNCR